MAWARKRGNGPWNCPLASQLRNKKGGNSFSNFSINKEPSASKKKKGRGKQKYKKRAITQTRHRQKEEKKREAPIKRVTSSRKHRFVYGISLVIFFSKSLSPSFSNLNFCLVMQIGSSFMGSSYLYAWSFKYESLTHNSYL